MKKIFLFSIALLISVVVMSFSTDNISVGLGQLESLTEYAFGDSTNSNKTSAKTPNFVDLSDKMCKVHKGDTLVIYYLYGKLYIRPIVSGEFVDNSNYIFVVQ